MHRLVLIDGNSIMNRAFYGIMGNKMLTTSDGTYTNAVYGFLSILFKIEEDLNPEYIAVAFDLKGPTQRHKMYEEYKANRHGMPDELATQMPIIKDVLSAMNIKIIEKEGFEGDDILGTLAKKGEKEGLDVTILSGDRDTFQLTSDKITVRIPRTKMGKTENEDYDRNRIIEEYGVEPKELIEVKALMGDTSDNIPGIPGVGEKTALNLIRTYKTIDNLYNVVEKNKNITDIKEKLKEKIINNKELAYLSRELGKININVPLEQKISDLETKEWNKDEVLNLFRYLNFNRFIERFNMNEGKNECIENQTANYKKKVLEENTEVKKLVERLKNKKEVCYIFETRENKENKSILNKEIIGIGIYCIDENTCYYIPLNADKIQVFKEIFEDKNIKKIGYKQKEDYILLKELNIAATGFYYDIEIAAYLLNPTKNKYELSKLAMEYANIDLSSVATNSIQMNLFETDNSYKNEEEIFSKVYSIYKIYVSTEKELKNTNQLKLFNNIEMPLVEVLADMQYTGIYADRKELVEFGETLKLEINNLTKNIFKLAGEEFNINSTKQLGAVLFEKLKLPVIKKTKNGYSTDVEVLEKLKGEHEIIEKILEYRQLMKINSTYVEGLIPYIDPKDERVHSYFHQTVTATGRISSSDPNVQNIPTRFELGKKIRKVFKPKQGYVFVDADYSQIELRVLAHISNDEHMIQAFNNNEDIHTQTASKVFDTPINEVTKKQRSDAKAVNFGIVYGISDFGLSEQLGITKKQAKTYIEQYLSKYTKIKEFMENIKKSASDNGYVETLFNRRRYIPEITSKNYMIRQFGARVAMNTPIQGTAADIMKIAMIKLFNKLKQMNLSSKILLQIHDELLLEVKEEEKETVKKILRDSMENAINLNVPLKVELSEALNWYETK